MITAKELRNLAWNDLKREDNYWSYVKAGFAYFGWTIVAYLLAALPVIAVLAVFGICFGWSSGEKIKMAVDASNALTLVVACTVLTVAVVAAVVGVFWFHCWMSWGFCRLSLSCVRGKGDRKEIYSGRPHAGRMLDLLCWQSVYVFLWSLLFIIPGILAQLSYSQAKFLLVEHPDWTAKECLAESKRIMHGQRWRYFCFGLSYLGWYFLNGILAVFVGSVTGLGGIVHIFFNPYYGCGSARFYEHLITRRDCI